MQLNVVPRNTGQIGFQEVRLLGFVQIDCRLPAAWRLGTSPRLMNQIRERGVDFLIEIKA